MKTRKIDKKAGVPVSAIVLLLVAIAVIIAVFVIGTGAGDDPYIPDPPEPIDPDDPSVGSFGQEIILIYTDGTEQSVKELADNPALAVLYQGNEVESFIWRLSAKASGNTQTTVQIDYSGYALDTELTQYGNTNVIHTYRIPFSGTTSIAVDDIWHTVVESTKAIDNVVPDTMMGQPYLTEGQFEATFISDGILRYNDGGIWKNADNPVDITVVFDVEHGTSGDLVVTFKGEVDVS